MAKVRTTLTASLHTVTAVSGLASHLLTTDILISHDTAVRQALAILGYENTWAPSDTVFAQCVIKTTKLSRSA
jgi:hypothetical protein